MCAPLRCDTTHCHILFDSLAFSLISFSPLFHISIFLVLSEKALHFQKSFCRYSLPHARTVSFSLQYHFRQSNNINLILILLYTSNWVIIRNIFYSLKLFIYVWCHDFPAPCLFFSPENFIYITWLLSVYFARYFQHFGLPPRRASLTTCSLPCWHIGHDGYFHRQWWRCILWIRWVTFDWLCAHGHLSILSPFYRHIFLSHFLILFTFNGSADIDAQMPRREAPPPLHISFRRMTYRFHYMAAKYLMLLQEWRRFPSPSQKIILISLIIIISVFLSFYMLSWISHFRCYFR